jgi:hypothetical protein
MNNDTCINIDVFGGAGFLAISFIIDKFAQLDCDLAGMQP